MLQFQFYNKTRQLPELNELSWSDYLALMAATSNQARIEALLHDDLSGIPGDIRGIDRLISLVDGLEDEIQNFLGREIILHDVITVEFFGRSIKFTKDLGKLPYWPYTKVKQVISNMGNEPYNKYEDYPTLCAHYLYEKATGNSYDELKAEEFIEEIIKLPFTTIITLGDFFLYIQRSLWLSKKECSLMSRTMKKTLRGLNPLCNLERLIYSKA